ncbi:MAG: hypothetical protein ACFCU4_06050 [Puniceicoccaceae bacterium]
MKTAENNSPEQYLEDLVENQIRVSLEMMARTKDAKERRYHSETVHNLASAMGALADCVSLPFDDFSDEELDNLEDFEEETGD